MEKNEEYQLAEKLKTLLTMDSNLALKHIAHVRPLILQIMKEIQDNKNMPKCCQEEIAKIVVGNIMKYSYKSDLKTIPLDLQAEYCT